MGTEGLGDVPACNRPRKVQLMKKLLLVSMVLLLVFAFAAPGSADPNHEGFVLANTDAAYVQFSDGGCDVFVGYVWAKTLKYFGQPGAIHPHTDVDVKVTDCAEWESEGVKGTLDDPDAGIVKLESAFVHGIVVPLDSGYTAVVYLDWEAKGDKYKQQFAEPGMRANHQTRDADAVGTVTIVNGATTLKTFNVPADGYWSIITHYTEIQK